VRCSWVLCVALATGDCRGSALGSGSQDGQLSADAANGIAAMADSGTHAQTGSLGQLDGKMEGTMPSSGAGACARPDSATVRLLLPQSGSIVTSNRPRFAWTGAAGPYQLQVCADRACNTVLLQSVTNANEMAFAKALPPGYWFWRVQATSGSTCGWTSAWEMRIRRRFPGYAPISNTSVAGFSDYNGDGYPDVAVISAAPLVYLGGPDGLVADRVLPNAPAGPAPMALIEPQTDVNGDGFTDVSNTVPGPSQGGSSAHVQFGTSTGLSSLDTFIETYHASGNPVGLGDFNGDGYGDLAMQYRHGADLMLGCVSKTAWAGLHCSACQLQQLATGDFDGDGRTDIVFADGGNISLYMGNSNSATWRAIVGSSGLAVVDFNYDGFSDLVFRTPAGVAKAYEGGRDGLSPTLSTSSLPPFFALVGDFDGDGYWDTIGESGPQTDPANPPPTAVAYGGPAGWGAPATRTTTLDPWAFYPFTAIVVDVNADGYDDVVVQHPGETEMYWYAGSPAGLAPTPTRSLVH
jgi:FG-GAP-like repeat